LVDRDIPAWQKPGWTRLQILIFMLPVISFFGLLWLKVEAPQLYRMMIREDGWFEWIQALAYLSASLVALWNWVLFFQQSRMIHGALQILFALVFLFIFCEEISWGQRIIHYQTPERMVQNNDQQEMTLHNHVSVQPWLYKAYMGVGLYGVLGWLILARMRKDRQHFTRVLVPDGYISSWFMWILAGYSVLYVLRPYLCRRWGGDEESLRACLMDRDQESAELFLALGFLLFMVSTAWKAIQMGKTLPKKAG